MFYDVYVIYMKTTRKKPIQIYVEPRQYIILESLSKRRGVSKAAIIRESLEQSLEKISAKEDPAMSIVGLGRSGKGDLSERHDEYLVRLAGKKKRHRIFL